MTQPNPDETKPGPIDATPRPVESTMVTSLSDAQRDEILYGKLHEAFTPAGPISRREMFKGRLRQIQECIEAILQPQQHLVIIGERGVGKSSLANIIYDLMASIGTKGMGYWYAKVSCGRRETFSSLWQEALKTVRSTRTRPGAGFVPVPGASDEPFTLDALLGEGDVHPSRIVSVISQKPGAWVFDEFNTLKREEAQPFADLIKALSDAGSEAKLVLVGVADSIATLVADHSSIDRSIRQVLLPRMSPSELRQIIEGAESVTGMQFREETKTAVVGLSQGLPYFTHQVGLCSAKVALHSNRPVVDIEDVRVGIDEALNSSEESIREAYRLAVHSQKGGTLYRDVLLACALAPKDELGFFQQNDVVDPLSDIRGRHVTPGVFAARLTAFCSSDRGRILSERGAPYQRVYRFSNPLLQAYAIMMGVKNKSVPTKWLATTLGSPGDAMKDAPTSTGNE